jgi:hypothetical protein
VFPLIVGDLMRGTGRFNVAQGPIADGGRWIESPSLTLALA